MRPQSADVSHSAMRPIVTRPPNTGSAQLGRFPRGSASIFATKAPKKKQPKSECRSTRVEADVAKFLAEPGR